MGKIRTKIIGSEDVEKEQAEKAAARREAKKQRQDAVESTNEPTPQVEEDKGQIKVKAPGTKGGERTVAVGADEENLRKIQAAEKSIQQMSESEATTSKKARKKSRPGKKHMAARRAIDRKKTYSIEEAVSLIRKNAYAKFDETVELHLNLNEKGIKGEVTLPHTFGKEVNVRIVDDATIDEINVGKLDFDVLIARPSDMPKLVSLAKVLGPKGLMPNPKNGTISDDPETAAAKLRGGATRYKSEAKFPLLHQPVGKLSFKDEELTANIGAMIKAVNEKNIQNAYLSSTMSPSVNLDITG